MKKVLVLVLLFSVVSFSVLHAESRNYAAPDAADASNAGSENDYAPNALVTMGEVVVTATRDTQEIRKTPANVSVITAEEIEKSGATTVVEALDKLESIQFRTSSGNSSQAYIDMRGIGGDDGNVGRSLAGFLSVARGGNNNFAHRHKCIRHIIVSTLGIRRIRGIRRCVIFTLGM